MDAVAAIEQRQLELCELLYMIHLREKQGHDHVRHSA